MSMTRKDFALTAEAIRTETEFWRKEADVFRDSDSSIQQMKNAATVLANAYSRTYPNFNSDTFMRACGF